MSERSAAHRPSSAKRPRYEPVTRARTSPDECLLDLGAGWSHDAFGDVESLRQDVLADKCPQRKAIARPAVSARHCAVRGL